MTACRRHAALLTHPVFPFIDVRPDLSGDT
jgi:hypothetical protein